MMQHLFLLLEQLKHQEARLQESEDSDLPYSTPQVTSVISLFRDLLRLELMVLFFRDFLCQLTTLQEDASLTISLV